MDQWTLDTVFSTKEIKVRTRKEEKNERIEKELKRREQAEALVSLVDSSGDEETEENHSLIATNSDSHRRRLKTGMPGFFKHDLAKNPAVLESCVRNNISPAV